MRALLLLIGLSLSLLLGTACSDKEGILLNISTNMEHPIDRLEFVIGEDTGLEYFSERSLRVAEPLDGQDLRLKPFKLFLRANTEDRLSGDLQSDTIVVAVRALSANGEVIGFGHSDVLRFSPGEIREWSVEIVEQVPENAAACLEWENTDGPYVQLATADDRDCDGYTKGQGDNKDCNDDDSSINPGAEERCSSQEDKNCDGKTGSVDADGDGFDACSMDPEQRDCNDEDKNVFPMSVFVCEREGIICGDETTPAPEVGDTCYEFNDGLNQCFEGVLACADTASDSPFKCTTFTGAEVRPGFCLPEECNPTEPEVCAPTEHIQCELTFTLPGKNGGQVCNSDGPLSEIASVSVPRGPPTCRKAKIEDEFAVPGWKLKVIDGPTNNCIGDVIEARRTDSNINGALSLVLIQQFDSNGTVLYQYVIDVSSTMVENCAKANGLQCNSLANGGEWEIPVVAAPMG